MRAEQYGAGLIVWRPIPRLRVQSYFSRDARGPDRVLGDHPLFVGRDDEDDRRRLLGADDLGVGAVRFGVEMDSHPFHAVEDRFAHAPRVFADARR